MHGAAREAGLKTMVPAVLATSVVGAIVFVVAQKLAGFPQTIPQFMGGQIVTKGGYPPGLAGLIGWGVHLCVSLSYAALFALAVHFTVGRAARPARLLGAALIALFFGFVSTLITAPAIAITIGVLSGSGMPDALPPLNTTLGFVFWNHVGFFAIALALIVVLPDIRDNGA